MKTLFKALQTLGAAVALRLGDEKIIENQKIPCLPPNTPGNLAT
jgi:hypothetical protein